MGEISIYKLTDPLTKEIRYIGKTRVSLHERLRLHITCSIRAAKPTRKEKWIVLLAQNGHKPIIEIIEVVEKTNWREREVFWIEKGKELGWPLLNLKKGGDGYDNLTHSQKWKDELSRRMKGNKHGLGKRWTPEQRALIMKSRSMPWNKGVKGVVKHSDDWRRDLSKRMSGENHPMSKFSDKEILVIKERAMNENNTALAKELNISYKHLWRIKNNKRKICV